MAETKRQAPTRGNFPRIVIVGAGFAGLSAAKALSHAAADIVLIDRDNYHLFQPLLYQVATAALSPADIASPIRAIMRRQRNVTVMLGRVTDIDKAARLVRIGEKRVPYDYLIVGTGARHAYFGHDAWEEFAPGLKNIGDATAIRRRILLAFEHAENTADEEERKRLMSFIVIGAGPTGVELAGAIAELARVALIEDFRRIDPHMSRIILVEAGPRILASFSEHLAASAARSLQRLGVELRLGHPVTECDRDGVSVGGERIEGRTILWAAGVAASPAATWLAAESDANGRVIVGRDLTLPGHPEIFVAGDTARVVDAKGRPLPGIAPVAKQEGKFIGRSIAARLDGRTPSRVFRYRNLGNLATIGRKSAVADFRYVGISGRFAWLLWSVAHIYFLIGFRNRLAVALDWIWAYLTFQRGARLIVDGRGDADE